MTSGRSKNQYFLKDKQAKIYHMTETGVDRYGIVQRQLVSISSTPLWCYSSQLSQNKLWIASSLDTSETRYFVFNNLGDKVKPLDYIKYRDKWYRITRVDTKDDYNGDMFIYVEDFDAPSSYIDEPITT